uniref:Thioredoxin domain-containing protein n=1 Tax=Plectus sambesii TaxID=2011161 RepID=A0A914XDZ6_9BILA
MAALFAGVELQKKDGSKAVGEVALKDKIVGIYFSAHWCGPCRHFTPVLKDFYDALIKNGAEFEIVFVSSDGSEDDLKKYMEESHGNWYFLPFDSEENQRLSDKFEVDGIPTLVVVKSNGDVISTDARANVDDAGEKTPAQVFQQWKSA